MKIKFPERTPKYPLAKVTIKEGSLTSESLYHDLTSEVEVSDEVDEVSVTIADCWGKPDPQFTPLVTEGKPKPKPAPKDRPTKKDKMSYEPVAESHTSFGGWGSTDGDE